MPLQNTSTTMHPENVCCLQLVRLGTVLRAARLMSAMSAMPDTVCSMPAVYQIVMWLDASPAMPLTTV